MRKFYLSLFCLASLIGTIFTVSGFAQDSSPTVVIPETTVAGSSSAPATASGPQLPNVYAEQFIMMPTQRLQYQTSEVSGFIVLKTPDRQRDAQYSLVTDFGGGVLKTQYLSGMKSLDDVKRWIDDHLETAEFEGVDIKRLTIPAGKGQEKTLYWVGNKSFDSLDKAKAEVALVQSVIQAQGGNFQDMVKQAQAFLPVPEQAPPVQISPAQFQKEEDMILKMLDQLDIGEKLYGPFQGVSPGEPIVWQSFGETSWRKTNLEPTNFSDQVGFWTNRLVFKGIRAPLNTIDPFVEATASMESTGVDFASNIELFGGFEWRPLQQNPWFYNFRPWGGIAILEWMRNWRLYVMYGNRKNLKDEIKFSRDYDLIYGAQIFYEWGVELPPLDQPPPRKFSEYVEQYVWGEYFGDYRWEKTNFGIDDDFNAWIFNSTVSLGVKLPGIPLPPNPINDELVLMPYFRFEHVNNSDFSFTFQNYYFVAVGCRWMPFRNWRFKENEWLSKTKIFGEFVGVGNVGHYKQDGEVPFAQTYDLRFGVNISNRRF